MGCDIHTMAEVLGEDGVWRMVAEPAFPNVYYDKERHEAAVQAEDTSYAAFLAPMTNKPYEGRNYRLFAVLANVRNGYGFAGVDTGDAVEPVAMPKGVPDDASLEWQAVVADWGPDLHSMSWLTVAELRAYNWERPLTLRGLVNATHYETLTEPGQTPDEWSGGVFGPTTQIFNEIEYKRARANGTIKDEDVVGVDRWACRIFIEMQWHTSLRREVGFFVDETIPALGRLHEDPRKVRLVFGFDN